MKPVIPLPLLAVQVLWLTFPPSATADEAELFRSQQRQQQLESVLTPEADVRRRQPSESPSYLLSTNETPCLPVRTVVPSPDSDGLFAFLPAKVIKKTGFEPGMCLGTGNLQILQRAAQEILLERGYITSQAVIKPQDISDGILELDVVAGRVGNLAYTENDGEKAAAGRIGAFANKFPLYKNKVLNLRDVEQGLENLRRLPSVEADIRIMPSETDGASDLLVEWRQRKPVRFSIGIDNGGGKTTGKYQGNAAVSFDNPLGLSDLFYVSYGRDLADKTELTAPDGVTTKSGSRSYSVHYSVPFKKWLLSFDHNGYRYHEATEGYALNYDYNGRQYRSALTAERTVWRNGRHKTTAVAGLWTRQVYKYIDDTEIEVQRRRTAGWEAELRHRAYLGRWQLDGRLSYRRGTGMRGSLSAPEEQGGDAVGGTSRMKIVTAGLEATTPFTLAGRQFVYETVVVSQWNKTPLTGQDKFAVGSRYTVRGFDGEQNLSGERGFYWRNTLSLRIRPQHQLYFGLDTGRVSGESTRYTAGKRLSGAVVGLRGQQKVGGILHYDLFAGTPLHKPADFQTASVLYGFGLNYSF